MILVIDHNNLTFDQRYRLFNDWDKAIEEAIKVGYEETFIGINRKVGILNSYMCGEDHVDIIELEPNKT